MDLSRITDRIGDLPAAALAGLLVGALFGFAAQRSAFCLRAATVEFARGRLGPRLGVWLLTFSSAVVWVQVAQLSGRFDPGTARMMSDYLFVLAVSNCCYLVFNFLNLNSGWLHRIDNAKADRPWRAPTIMIWIGTMLSFVNAALLGAGANVWGEGTLRSAIFAIALILPVFAWRHYVTDKGHFPAKMLEDLQVGGNADLSVKKAGMLPYLTLAAGIATVLVANQIFRLN